MWHVEVLEAANPAAAVERLLRTPHADRRVGVAGREAGRHIERVSTAGHYRLEAASCQPVQPLRRSVDGLRRRRRDMSLLVMSMQELRCTGAGACRRGAIRRRVRVASALAGLVVATVLMTACGSSSHGPPYAASALDWAVPDPWTSSGAYLGMGRYTAAELNRMHWGSRWATIDYVPADVPSTRPDQVSVNPIDNYTWGAAAYSVRTHRCYLILTTHDRVNPGYGTTYYGRLPSGDPCLGAEAKPGTVTSEHPPPAG